MEHTQYRFKVGILTGTDIDVHYVAAIDAVQAPDAFGYMTFPGVDGQPVFLAQQGAVAYVHRISALIEDKPVDVDVDDTEPDDEDEPNERVRAAARRLTEVVAPA